MVIEDSERDLSVMNVLVVANKVNEKTKQKVCVCVCDEPLKKYIR